MIKQSIVYSFFLLLFFACQNENASNSANAVSSEEEIFKLHDAKDSNLSFMNNVFESNTENYLNYEFIYNGAGVAVGDINNDGLPDIYFAGNSVSDKLFLNKGSFKFEDISIPSGISTLNGWSTGVNMIDINQDGWLDIYVCRSGPSPNEVSRTNRLYINQGNNTFIEDAANYGLANNNYSIQSAFFDYDLDGDLDLYLLNHPKPGFKPKKSGLHMEEIRTGVIRTDYFYENIDGKFVDKTFDANLFNFGFRHGIAVGDVNKDGYPDLYVSSDFDEPDAFYINNGNKTFSNKIDESLGHISFNSMGNELADVNNDGDLDLFVVDMAPEDHYRSKLFMASMDVQRFRSLQASGYHNQYMFNTLQMNNSDGSFKEIAQYAGLAKSDWSWGPLFFDMDFDGYKDLVITNGIKENFMYNDLQKDINIATNGTGQIDIQGLLQLVPSDITENQVYKNLDGVKFEKRTKDWFSTLKFNSNGVATADFDNDGDLDFVTNNMLSNATIYESLAADKNLGNFIKIRLRGKAGNLNAIGAKVEVSTSSQIQFTELHRAKGYLSSIDLPVVFGLRDENVVDLKITWPDNNVSIHKNLTVNKEHQFDYSQESFEQVAESSKGTFLLAQTNVGLSYNHQEDLYDDYKKQILLPHSQSNIGPSTAKADVNGDGLIDLFVGAAAGQSSALYIMGSDGNYSKKVSGIDSDKSYEDTGACFFDADNDGDVDLYVVSGGAHLPEFHQFYTDRLYINDGKGNFRRSSALPSGVNISGQGIAASDIDKDGDIDLFIGGRLIPEQYPYAPESFFLINNNGKFTKKSLAVDNLVSAVLFADINGDGFEDLITAGEWSPVNVFINNKGEFKPNKDSSLEGTNGLWFSLNAADVDGDGDMDLVAGNLGLNTKFKANSKKKFQVYCNDFDNNGTFDVVLSTNYKGYDVPTRGRECSSQQMPFIAQEFKDYHSFASASMDDIYGEDLENALNKKIDILYSAFFENDGSGNFTKTKLPWQSQMAPVQDIEFSDVDGDGVSEVLLVGDLYNVEVETVRYDASTGVVLKWTENGFVSMSAKETGFVGKGDARKVEVLEQPDGKKIIVIANNNGPLETFRSK
jgi:enediyne biosynthesis protein E4